ncbi:zinc-dependent alcohol dehydrogenase [Saliphagus infecundisoli]|uniref:zinc-dependent alcohol dehydrogenase n=1 Tax=Saliphagus infecundisoli TaxID=1849069 RepID=UPI001CD1F3A0|nr:zinc-binding alcohol dehydrogenase [Saliphagus infecundisoli]
MCGNETVVFESPEAVIVEQRNVPVPDPNEVLVESRRTLVSTGTELTILSGDFPEGSRWDHYEYPFVPGYNNVGVVVETGNDVVDIETGQRVATLGSHAQYVTASPEGCRPIPDDVSDDAAVFFTIAEIVMNGVRRGEVTWGESAVVFGLGLLGQLAVRVCQLAGAQPVVGVEPSAPRLDRLPDSPTVAAVDPTAETAEDSVARLTDNRMADVAFEVTGNPDVIPEEFDVLREQGRLVLLSSPRGTTEFNFHDDCNAPSHTIIGAHNSSHPSVATSANPWTNHRHCELFFSAVADGTISVADLVSHRIEVADVPAMYDKLLADRSEAMGVVIKW